MAGGSSIGHTSFVFIVGGIMNDIISIILIYFIVAIVQYWFPNNSFTRFQIYVRWTAPYCVSFDLCFLVSFFPIFAWFSGVTVNEFLSIGPEIS